MLTKLDDLTLVRYGTRYRTRYLVAQVRYTMQLAGAENPPLDLPVDYLSRIEGAIARLEATSGERTVAEVESKLATERQNELFAQGKAWRRKLAARAHRAARLGADIPDRLLTIGRADTVPKLLDSMATMLELASSHASELACLGAIEPLLAEGESIREALSEADAVQEVKRLSELPLKVRELLRLKGELYVALKIVNDAGKERHVGDPLKAAQYNLSILYRRGARHGGPEEARAS